MLPGYARVSKGEKQEIRMPETALHAAGVAVGLMCRWSSHQVRRALQ
jgi:hypothetical protein